MTEQNEQSKEELQVERLPSQEDTTNEYKNEQLLNNKLHKMNWLKKITKQTAISSAIFFILGGTTVAAIGHFGHSNERNPEFTFNKEFPEGEHRYSNNNRGENRPFGDEEAPDANSGASKSENNNNDTTDSTEDNAVQNNSL